MQKRNWQMRKGNWGKRGWEERGMGAKNSIIPIQQWFCSTLPSCVTLSILNCSVPFFFNITSSPPDGWEEWEHITCKSASEWRCTSLGVQVSKSSHKVKSSCTPIPRTWALDLTGQATASFVFTLHVSCGLLFSDIVEGQGKFEGEVGRRQRAK